MTEKQQQRLAAVFADDHHVAVEVMWSVYQDFIQGYRDPNKEAGKALIQASIAKLNDTIPKGLPELKRIGATLNRRRDDIVAYFDRPRTSNGPTEAINGRLENLRGNALGFRNLANYIRRCLLDAGGFRPRLHPQL